MLVRNPYYVDPIDAAADALVPPITAYLQSKPGKEFIGLAKLRANIPAVAAASRDVINHALSRMGIRIDEGGDDNA